MLNNINVLESMGWIGGMLLAACGLPQAFKSWRQKHSYGLSIWFLLMWLFGEILVLIYVLPKWHWPLIFNYSANIILVLIILYYKLYPCTPTPSDKISGRIRT